MGRNSLPPNRRALLTSWNCLLIQGASLSHNEKLNHCRDEPGKRPVRSFGSAGLSFPVQRDEHLLMVLRYVLQNLVGSGLAGSIDDWPWSSWYPNERTTRQNSN
jgi:hypothetical protein